MRTRFELVLEGSDPVRLRAAGEEALREIERVEALLSRYQAASVVSAVNANAAKRPVPVGGEVLALLRLCAEASAASGGAFDISVGALVDVWRAAGAAGRRPEPDVLRAARADAGMSHVVIHEGAGTVRFLRPGVSFDLGAAGKGYAVDRAVECLRDAGISHALLHGGTSSVHAVGPQANGQPWPIAWASSGAPADARVAFPLTDEALSISATHGGVIRPLFGHVLDPRTGEPVPGARAASVRGPSSLMCDILSTALLVRGRAWLTDFHVRWPQYHGQV